MDNSLYIWFICLSIILAFIYVGMIYWKRYDVEGLDKLNWSRFFLYTGTPAVILTLGMTLYSMYQPMKHYPPLFILILYALLGGLYTITIGYLGYSKVISIPVCISLASVFLAIVVGIFMYTPSTYDEKIDDTQNKFNKDITSEELDTLREELMKTFSDKNKYYIQWFIVLLYIPIVVHYLYRCVLNPIAYQNLYDFVLNLFNLKGQKMETSYVKQSNNVLETLSNLDKQIKYTAIEKSVIDKIRTAVAENKMSMLTLNEEDYKVLRRIRSYLEKKEFYDHNNTNIQAIYKTITDLIHYNKVSIQEHGLYLMNIIVIMVVMIYVFIYQHTTKILIIPLITVVFSLAIFYLNG